VANKNGQAAKETTCIVPTWHGNDHVSIPVSCTGKRITLMARISADGSALKPEVVIPRKVVGPDLILTGSTSERVTVRSDGHGFVDMQLSESWFETIFVPELVQRRINYSYHGPGALFRDNCSAYIEYRFRELCSGNGVIPCYFPPHSPNQFEPPNLCLSGITGRFIGRANRLDASTIQTRHITFIVCTFMVATVSSTVMKAFDLSGVCLVGAGGVLPCTVRSDMWKRLLVPLPSTFPDILDSGSVDSVGEEVRVFVEVCAGFLYDLEAETPE
jgi:hypothetical protein